MRSINAQILEKNGKKQFVVLPYEDFLEVQETLACYDDLQILRKAKKEEKDAPSISLSQAKTILNMRE